MHSIAAAWLVLVLPLLLTPAWAETLEGHVIHVADGDTITVLDAKHQQLRVRLDGIDARNGGRRSPSGQPSTSLSLFGGRSSPSSGTKKDRYGRLVGNVCVKGMDVGLEQLRAGLAWHYKRFEREQTPENRSRYAKAETMARAARAGLWQDKEALPPWEWRARQRASSTMNSLNAHRGR